MGIPINVIIIGPPGSGKKTIIQQFSQQMPSGPVGLENKIVTSKQYERHVVQFHIWNMAGVDIDGEKCREVYAYADVIVICLSADDPNAQEKVYNLIPEITHCTPPPAPHLLVRNKTDLYKPNSGMLSHKDAELLAWGMHAYCCLHCSALNENDVLKIFEVVGEAFYKKLKNKKKECTVQ